MFMGTAGSWTDDLVHVVTRGNFMVDPQTEREKQRLNEYPDSSLTHSSVSKTTPHPLCLKHREGGVKEREIPSLFF